MQPNVSADITQGIILRNTTLSNEERTKTLQLLGTYTRNRFPVSTFAERFLPFFCGLSDPTLRSEHMAVWYGISGGPSTEVDLVDERGQKVAIVPAIFNTNFDYANIDLNENTTFARLLNVCALESTNIAAIGINNLRKALLDKIQVEGLPGVNPLIQQMWLDLFIFFQSHPVVIQSGAIDRMRKEIKQSTSIHPGVSLADSVPSDEFEFD